MGFRLYVSGSLTVAGGTPVNGMARWDGKAWSAVPADAHISAHALAVHDDGTGPALYAAGTFTVANGAPGNRIAKWDGAEWSTLGLGMNAAVRALAVFDDGLASGNGDGRGDGPALFVGGDFTMAGNETANRIAKWTGPLLGDLDCDGAVSVFDLLQLLDVWGACNDCLEDLDGNGEVNVLDLLIVLSAWS